MTEKTKNSEQIICINCGFCCDGTLFYSGCLEQGERGTLPEKIEKNYFIDKNKEYFKLPCLYFDKKCTIYNQKKAKICSSYRCQLLFDVEDNKMMIKEALQLVENAKQARNKIFKIWAKLTGDYDKITFNGLLIKLGYKSKELNDKKNDSLELNILLAQCNVLEALFVKHFKSEKKFMALKGTNNKSEN